MDFAVATIRCFDTVKVHHDKRWLRQQRLLLISTHEILNCPWPAAGTKAMKLCELFSQPIDLKGNKNNNKDETTSTVSSTSTTTAPPVPVAIVPLEGAGAGGDSSKKSSSASGSKNPLITEQMILLEERYQQACAIILTTGNNNDTKNLANLMQEMKTKITFEDVKRIMNPSKSNSISDVTSTSLKGDDHLCINFKNDHPYFYNTPRAIEAASIVRSRYVAWSSARLVEGNFIDEDDDQDNRNNNNSSSLTTSNNLKYRLEVTNNNMMVADDDDTSNNSSPSSSPNAAAPTGANFDDKNINTKKKNNNDDDDEESNSLSQTVNSNNNNTNNMMTDSFVGFSRISELFQAGVIELPTTFDVVDHLQSQIMILTKSLDWHGEPSSVFTGIADSLKKLSEDTSSWSSFEATIRSEEEAKAQKQRAIDTATSPNSRSRAQSQIVIGNPSKAKEFRARFDEIRNLLVNNYLVSGVKEIVQPEKSLTEKLAFWRSPRRIPQFEEPDEAELVAEIALQNLLFRESATLKNLWADIQVAHREEMELFGFNCRMLSAPVVPFSYFGIAAEFETVRFDLVRYHLRSLMGCKTPSLMLNCIVAAIKSVIVCVKAKHVLSKRWNRAFSEPPASSGAVVSAPSTATMSNANNNNDGSSSSKLSSQQQTQTQAQKSSSPSPASENFSSTTSAAGGFWTREELDQISREAQKHSSYNTDDILPVFIYIVAHCDLPQLLLYNRFLEILSFEGEASERSFYVTVFYSAIQWILDWRKPEPTTNRSTTPGMASSGRDRTDSKISNLSSAAGSSSLKKKKIRKTKIVHKKRTMSLSTNNVGETEKKQETEEETTNTTAPPMKQNTAINLDDSVMLPPTADEKKEQERDQEENLKDPLEAKDVNDDDNDKKKNNETEPAAGTNANNKVEDEEEYEDYEESYYEEVDEEQVLELTSLEDEFFSDDIWEQAAELALAGTRGEKTSRNTSSPQLGSTVNGNSSLPADNNAGGTKARAMSRGPFSQTGFGGARK